MATKEIPPEKIPVVKWMIKSGKTKKACCEYLKIPYNTKKLQDLIDEYDRKQSIEKKLREENKKRQLKPDEIQYIISEYLYNNASISGLADHFFMPFSRIKKVLTDNEIPIRARKAKAKAKIDHINKDNNNLNKKIPVGVTAFLINRSCPVKILDVYDEEYLDMLTDIEHIELLTFHPWVKTGITDFSNNAYGKQFKLIGTFPYFKNNRYETEKIDILIAAAKYKDLLKFFIEYGQEMYKVRTNPDDKNAIQHELFVKREDIYYGG